jgi:DNA polymerase III subunit epsilon
MSGLHPIFYDTETTGIKPDKDRIIEIAAYDLLRDRTFEELIHPDCLIPSEVTAINHITDAMVADRPKFSEIGRKFVDFCGENVVLIAHNNECFDLPFLRQEFLRHGIDMPASWQCFDTLKWARRYRPDLPRHTLQFLREIYEIPANNAHRALDDVKVLHQVFSLMVDDLSIEEVIQLIKTAPPREISVMPFGKYQGQLLTAIPPDYIRWLHKSGTLEKPENVELRSSLVKLES